MAGPMTQAIRPSEMPPTPRTAEAQVSAAIAQHQPAERRSDRVVERRSERPYTAPEPHEKFAIPSHMIPSGMDAIWLPITIMGAKNPDVLHYYRSHWRPARADQFPEFSGYGIDYGPALNASGVLTNVTPESPVILDGQMLVLRPKEISQAADAARRKAATKQISTQFERLRGRSLREVGPANTRIKRQFAPADDGDDVAEEA